MASNRMELSITGLPAVLFAMRLEMAKALRSAAEAEADPRVRRRLEQVAADFETGCQGDGL